MKITNILRELPKGEHTPVVTFKVEIPLDELEVGTVLLGHKEFAQALGEEIIRRICPEGTHK